MKYFLLGLILLHGFLLGTNPVQAYNPTINETVVPYEIQVINNNITSQAEYLGNLSGYPHMYEFTLGSPATLTLSVSQLATEVTIPFSLITVRENNKNAGVVEVGRLSAKDALWKPAFDPGLGLSFLQGKTFTASLNAGVYRVEVSTPDNFGPYMLTVGTNPSSRGYFATLGDVWTIHRFFDKSILSIFKSTYVYIPLGVIIFLTLLYFIRKRKGLFRHFHA